MERTAWPRQLVLRVALIGVAAAMAEACSGSGLGPSGGTGTAGRSSGGSAASNLGGTGGGSCQPGAEACPCYPNQTCNSGLECMSNVCVNPGGGGAPSAGGSSSTGAATSSGGVATGGTAVITGGTASGGVATGGLRTGGTSTGGTSAAEGARYVSGPWAGYVWTAAASGTGSTITPTTFDTHAPGTSFCASGSVGAMTDYSGVAMIGYNVNQAVGSDVAGTWTPSGTTGIKVSFTNSGGSALRLQIQGPNGATVASDRWCYPLTGSSATVTIPWTSFNTDCWDNTGTYYSGQPLQAVMIIVPGGNVTATSFSICLNSFAPA